MQRYVESAKHTHVRLDCQDYSTHQDVQRHIAQQTLSNQSIPVQALMYVQTHSHGRHVDGCSLSCSKDCVLTTPTVYGPLCLTPQRKDSHGAPTALDRITGLPIVTLLCTDNCWAQWHNVGLYVGPLVFCRPECGHSLTKAYSIKHYFRLCLHLDLLESVAVLFSFCAIHLNTLMRCSTSWGYFGYHRCTTHNTNLGGFIQKFRDVRER